MKTSLVLVLALITLSLTACAPPKSEPGRIDPMAKFNGEWVLQSSNCPTPQPTNLHSQWSVVSMGPTGNVVGCADTHHRLINGEGKVFYQQTLCDQTPACAVARTAAGQTCSQNLVYAADAGLADTVYQAEGPIMTVSNSICGTVYAK